MMPPRAALMTKACWGKCGELGRADQAAAALSPSGMWTVKTSVSGNAASRSGTER